MSKFFLTTVLDNDLQRKAIVQKVQEFITTVDEGEDVKVVYVCQGRWQHVGESSCLIHHITTALRCHHLLPSPRFSLLSLHDQYQAIQLCLARINSKKHGEFMAAASDVLDVWNEMARVTLASDSDVIPTDLEDLGMQTPKHKSQDPAYQEVNDIIQDYQEFLSFSNCVDHFSIYKYLKKNLINNQEFVDNFYSQVYIIEGIEEMPKMEKEILKLIIKDSKVYKIQSEFKMAEETVAKPDFNMSGIVESQLNSSITANDSMTDISTTLKLQSDQKTEEEMRLTINQTPPGDCAEPEPYGLVKIESITISVSDYIDSLHRGVYRGIHGSESELYIERLILAHVRLLINSRDELALTLACNMPGRGMTQQGFADIRCEAQKKKMSMYQTITSFILLDRLGGKGYQPDPSHPILAHLRPLGELVDTIMKLQDILEEQPDARKGAEGILTSIKKHLSKMKGCVLKRATLEKVGNCLVAALERLIEAGKSSGADSTQKVLPGTTRTLPPCLQHLVGLCDEASGHVWGVGSVVDVLGENVLTQFSSSKKLPSTPVRIPTILSLFRSPVQVEDVDKEIEGKDLRTRALRRSGIHIKRPVQPKSYQSDCAWAPTDLSPIAGYMKEDCSPIAGPSLKVVGRTKGRNWRQIVNAIDQAKTEEAGSTVFPTVASDTTPHVTNMEDGDKVKKSSKRSLLSDISNTADAVGKKQKSGEKKSVEKSKAKGKNKLKPLPAGQKSITSFFKV